MFGTISNVMSAVVMAFTAPLLAALPAADQAPFQPQVPQIQMMQPQGGEGQQFGGPQGGPQDRGGQFQGGGPAFQFGGPMNGDDRGFKSGDNQNFSGQQPGFQGRGGPQGEFRQDFGGQFQGGSFPPPQGQGPNMMGRGGGNFGGQPSRGPQNGGGQNFGGPEQGQGKQFNGGEYGGREDGSSFMMNKDGGSQGVREDKNQDYSNQGDDQSGEMEKRQAEIEKQQEERQKKMEEQQLRMMKQGLSSMEKGLKMTASMIDKLKKDGVVVPSDDETLISDLTKAFDVVKNATEMTDDVQAAMETLKDKGQDLRDLGPRLGMLSQWPKTLVNINKQIAKLRKDFDKAKTKASKSTINIVSIQTKIEKSISEIETARDTAKVEASKSDADFQDIMDNVQQDIFGPMQDVQNDISIFKNLSNIGLELKKVDTKLKNFGLRAATLKKAGADVSDLESLINKATEKRDEIRSLIAKDDVDPEEIFQAVSEGQGLLNDIMSEFSDLQKSN